MAMTFDDAVRDAIGLCQSEHSRWKHADPKTGEHWKQVADALLAGQFDEALERAKITVRNKIAKEAENELPGNVQQFVLEQEGRNMLQGSSRCDVCGKDSPHAHPPLTVELERYARPAFEKYFVGLLHRGPKSGLDPVGTYGWALEWKRRDGSGNYRFPQVQICWEVWSQSWIERGGVIPDDKLRMSVRLACGESAKPL
jgi:hypothetical protein